MISSLYFVLLFCFSFYIVSTFELHANGTLFHCNKKPSDTFSIPEIVHEVEDCHRKIRLTLNIHNLEKTPGGLEYVLVNDITDVESGVKLKLLNPLLVRLRQEQVLLAYPMKYLSGVNAKATEIVINYQNRKNFTGCDDTSPINPTCGIKHEKGVPIPFSEGFCCFCPDAASNGKQTRGGQDCSLTKAPFELNLRLYKSSAHCLQKNDIWYTVNALSEPTVLHQTFLQVYNLQHLSNSTSVWVALTHDEDFELSTKNPYQFDDNKTIIATYVTEKPDNNSISIPYETSRLLVPLPMPSVEPEKVPAPVKNGPSDYIVLAKDLINANGDVCDKAGISYEAFAQQNDRCDVPKNTCLKNQPLDFWEKDDAKRVAGQKGSYLLQFYGVPYKDPIEMDTDTEEHWLTLEYYKPHRTVIYIEVNADHIVALSVGKYGQITSILSVSYDKDIKFYVNIQNSGLVSAEFTVRVLRCGFTVPNSNNVTVIVPAQLKKEVVVSTKPGIVELDENFECVVELNSPAYGVIAMRDVTIKPQSRCICNLHCSCTCLGEDMSCELLTEEEYHLAGFKGSLPVLTVKSPSKSWFAKYPLAAFIAFLIIMLIIGLIKAGFGLLGYTTIGEFGLTSYLYKPKKLPHYFELELREASVVYDDDGFPINPDTKERTRVYNEWLLFVLNIFICCFFPYLKCSEFTMQKKEEYFKAKEDKDSLEGDLISSASADEISETNEGSQKPSLSSVVEISPSGEEGGDEEEEEIEPEKPEVFKDSAKKVAHFIRK